VEVGPFQCRLCGSGETVGVLDMGDQPMCDAFPSVHDTSAEPRWPLRVVFCSRCRLVQLGNDAPVVEEAMLAVESATALQHIDRSVGALQAAGLLHDRTTAAEFPTPHGALWLPALIRAGCSQADGTAPAQLVVDNHGLPHAADVRRHVATLASALSTDGTLVMEFHHLLPIVRQGQFDAFRHGHYSYLSLQALSDALAAHGIGVFDARSSSIYGGSLQIRAARPGLHPVDPAAKAVLDEEEEAGLFDAGRLEAMGQAAASASADLRQWLEEARAAGRRVLGYGAPSRASAILCAAGVGPDLLAFTADLSPAKHGLRVPGCGVPIRSPADLIAAEPDVVLILVWDLVDEIVRQLDVVRSWGGRFAVPLPSLREL
jgi:hypothetical protein